MFFALSKFKQILVTKQTIFAIQKCGKKIFHNTDVNARSTHALLTWKKNASFEFVKRVKEEIQYIERVSVRKP